MPGLDDPSGSGGGLAPAHRGVQAPSASEVRGSPDERPPARVGAASESRLWHPSGNTASRGASRRGRHRRRYARLCGPPDEAEYLCACFPPVPGGVFDLFFNVLHF